MQNPYDSLSCLSMACGFSSMGVKSKSKSLADRPVPRRTVAQMQGVFTDCDCYTGRKHYPNYPPSRLLGSAKPGNQCVQESCGATVSLKHGLCGVAISCDRCSLNWGKQFLQININIGYKQIKFFGLTFLDQPLFWIEDYLKSVKSRSDFCWIHFHEGLLHHRSV